MSEAVAADRKPVVDVDCIRSYFLYKAFDVISDGGYKKLVVKSKESNDERATALYANVQRVSSMIKDVVQQIHGLQEFGKHRLQAVCLDVLDHVNPPCRVKSCWNVCRISGIKSSECLDLSRAGKTEGANMVHRKFSHFVLMLWVVAKFEHLCKVYARRWLATRKNGETDRLSVQALCRAFEEESDVAPALHAAFTHAHSHVVRSLAAHRRVPAYDLAPRAPLDV